jgi:hypothetical protein
MVPVPCVVQDLLAHRVEHGLLISVLAPRWDVQSLIIDFEAIVRPERVVECEVPIVLRVLDVYAIIQHSYVPISTVVLPFISTQRALFISYSRALKGRHLTATFTDMYKMKFLFFKKILIYIEY